MFPIEFPYLEDPEAEYFCEIPGDLNLDGYVGSADLDIVRGNWGRQVPPGDLMRGDPSGDGYVGSLDLDIVRSNWGTSCPNNPLGQVPEPSTFVLLGSRNGRDFDRAGASKAIVPPPEILIGKLKGDEKPPVSIPLFGGSRGEYTHS